MKYVARFLFYFLIISMTFLTELSFFRMQEYDFELWHFVDTSNSMSFSEVRSEVEWKKVDPYDFNAGMSIDTHWFRLKVPNYLLKKSSALRIDNPHIDEVVLYKESADGIVFSIDSNLESFQSEFHIRKSGHNFFMSELKNGEKFSIFWLRVRSTSTIAVPVRITSFIEFIGYISIKNTIFGILLGIAIFSVATNLMVFWTKKKTGYLGVAGYLVFTFFIAFNVSGLEMTEFVKSPWWTIRAVDIYISLSVCFLAFFIRQEFLNRGSLLFRICTLILVFAVASVIWALAANESIPWNLTIANVLILAGMPFFLLAGHHSPGKIDLFLGLIFFGFSGVTFLLSSLGILPGFIRGGLLILSASTFQGIVFTIISLLDLRNRAFENQRVSAIAGTVNSLAHDLRAPLGAFERLLTVSGNDFPSMKGSIKESLNRLYSMIESLRYSETENLIKRHLARLDFRFGSDSLQIRCENCKVKLYVPEECSEWIFVDVAKVERAWINLATNAIEFARTFVKVQMIHERNDLYIRVVDDGPGVPDQFLPYLFQRGSTYGKSDGTGLGLAYVRQVLRGHGGDVRYYRENGMTIFECFLPNAVVNDEEKLETANTKKLMIPNDYKENQPIIKQVSICFRSDSLNQRVQERLSKISTDTYSFLTGFHQNSSIVLTDFEEMAESAVEANKRLIMFEDSLSDNEIVRRAPIRLGLRG